MEIKDVSLPQNPDNRKIVAAILTAAVCRLETPSKEAESIVCTMYQRFLSEADADTKEKALADMATLGNEL